MFPKRGAIALALTAVALVLLISFRTPADTATLTRGSTSTAGGTTGGTTSGSTGVSSTGRSAGTRTVDGAVVSTRYGPVQVSVTVSGKQITDVVALQLPDGDGRSSQISSRAEPQLRAQALQAQSAQIDGVSGATYTSLAYARSLQAALDSAGI